ncbi:hypothetical protein Sjap_001957 [Stephania japonica]|uniref:Uncharacterized protein n=1 Tax=Stephania japonica TaxID=461633 RepID=A0AAP0PS70_9MAGN
MAALNTEFNEADFAEYDPTPYGGGYDIAATYGAPLAPSLSTCYPNSLSKHNPSKPPTGSSGDPVKGEVVQAIPSHDHEIGLDQAKPGEDDEEEKSSGSNSNGNWLVDPSFDYSGSDNFSNGYGVCGSYYGYDYGCGGSKALSQFGYYSRDDLGPCAALFDYWPCLYRKDKMSYCDQPNEVKNFCRNQWESALDYLFGGWNPHGEIRDGVVTYGCRKHYAEEPISVLYDYNDEELSQCQVYNRNDWHYPDEQHVSVQYDCNEKSWSQINRCEVYYEEPLHGEQIIAVQCDYNEESWPQNTSHYEVYYEEPCLQPNYPPHTLARARGPLPLAPILSPT